MTEIKKLIIDGIEVEPDPNRTVLEVAEEIGIHIPTLCYHKALTPYGACRICTVETIWKGRSRLHTACTYPAWEGEVRTNSEKVIRARKFILELMLAEAPGSKEIQDLAREYGVERTDFEITKDKDNKCIMCSLCVRVCQNVMGISAIGFANRGDRREIVVPFKEYSELCSTCGACARVCPTGAIKVEDITKNKVEPIPSEFDVGLQSRPCIYIPFPQAMPNKPVIDRENCMFFKNGTCKVCQTTCKAEAIDFDQEDKILDLNVGAIIAIPGFDEFDAHLKPEYGYGRYPNVITSVGFERILNASGPFQGKIHRPSDGNIPKKIAFIQCVGSRDAKCKNDYCSAVCCMYTVKEAIIAKEHCQEIEPTIFFMDMRAYGKDFDKYYEKAKNEHGVRYVRSRVSEIKEDNETHNLWIKYENEAGELQNEEFELVVLSVGLEAPIEAKQLAKKLGIELNDYDFAKTDEFNPLENGRPGIFVGGAFQGPKDIPETVAQASGVAARASIVLADARGTLVKKKEYPPEIDVRYEGPRIGVFICHCGINIGAYVNVAEVVQYAKTLPNVIYVGENLYTCSQDTQELIKKAIQEHKLNRVVVAACTPRTHEPLFQDTIREAGLNKYLFEMANIRDQNSWVHMHEPKAATEKAKDLVRMAVAKARLIEPLQSKLLDITRRGLVIGGGISGMTAALGLAQEGYEVYLVEKEPKLGGNLRHIYYTLEGKDTQKFLNELIQKVQSNDKIQVFTNAEIDKIDGFVGNFKTTIKVSKEPKGANQTHELEHGIIIVATGAEEYKPTEYLYGKDTRVITQRELEKRLSNSQSPVSNFQSIVMIQCVGSRSDEHPYCSRVCCSEAIKNAIKLKEKNKDTNIYILYRDIRTYGFKETYYQKACELGVVFIRYEEGNEPEVRKNGKNIEVLVEDLILHEKLLINADLLVLSTATVAPSANDKIAKMLKVPLNEDGFFLEAHMKLRPVDFATDGIFLAGLAHGPKFIEESISQAYAAVARACTILSKDFIEAPATVAEVNERKCVACGLCEAVCAYGAIQLITKKTIVGEKAVAEINEALCKGCGTCVASCRSGSIDLRGFTTEEIVSQIGAMRDFEEKIKTAMSLQSFAQAGTRALENAITK